MTAAKTQSKKSEDDKPDIDQPGVDESTKDEANKETDVLAAVKAKADENWDQYLRVAAELENLRKRAERDVEAAHKFATEQFAADLLEVKDNLERGLSAVDEAVTVDRLKQGSELTLEVLSKVFGRFAIKEINPAEGETFDPTWHEAVVMQPSDEQPPNTVLSVMQKGYRLHDRLLRPARVMVAQAIPEDGKNQ
ncbi:MAG: nucleotide exchange factor GrpE [Gammaproteobacteria bacterium]|nr:nucleotide exchange factor GrpE [Gammaproteobacteria bacterium]